MEVLRRDLKLLVEDFGADAKLGPPISAYYHLLRDYQMRRGHDLFAIHTREDYVGF